jgi:hypothetical protein
MPVLAKSKEVPANKNEIKTISRFDPRPPMDWFVRFLNNSTETILGCASTPAT